MPPSRPRAYAPEIDELIVEYLLPKVADWMGASGADPTVREHLRAAVSRHEDDGYALALFLDEEYHYGSDHDLVEILKGAARRRTDEHERALLVWARTSGLRPRFISGMRVRVVNSDHPNYRAAGEVLATDAELLRPVLRYVVCFRSLGHDPLTRRGIRGIAVNDEDLARDDAPAEE